MNLYRVTPKNGSDALRRSKYGGLYVLATDEHEAVCKVISFHKGKHGTIGSFTVELIAKSADIL
jgi:hypothetical protein